jgi:hypothetical protein
MSDSTQTFLVALLMTVVAGLSGCASTGRSIFIQSEAPDAATIQARWLRESVFVWEGYSILNVDNKFVSVGFLGDPNTAATRVEPGSRQLVIRVVFSRGLGTGIFEAFVPLDAYLKPSSHYEINGNILGATVGVWLEESSSKERVTEFGTASYSRLPPAPAPVFIPILIPMHYR